jgi:Leucine-rich repeat (LRR) protein
LGQVNGIHLPNNGLKGTIPSEIQYLSTLRILDLSDNPDLVGTIPRKIGALTNLNEIRLSQTSLSGSIPSSLAQFEWLGK